MLAARSCGLFSLWEAFKRHADWAPEAVNASFGVRSHQGRRNGGNLISLIVVLQPWIFVD